MTITEYIALLEDVRSEYGDLDLITRELPFSESDMPTIATDIRYWASSLAPQGA